MGSTVKKEFQLLGWDKIYDFPTDFLAKSTLLQSPLLQRLKHVWIRVIISFLLFGASSQRKTSILLFDSCSPETAKKGPTAAFGGRIPCGGLRAGKRVEGCVCIIRGCENDFLQGQLLAWIPEWTIYPPIIEGWQRKFLNGSTSGCPFFTSCLNVRVLWKLMQNSVSFYGVKEKNVPLYTSIIFKKIHQM